MGCHILLECVAQHLTHLVKNPSDVVTAVHNLQSTFLSNT